jgi:hypothetical protein
MADLSRKLSRDPAIQRLLRDMERHENERELERVRANPEAHKLTRLMQPGKRVSYRHFKGGGVPGCQVHYGYCVWRNAAGYFLSFREVFNAATGEGERDKWVAHKTRKAARSTAERWARDSLSG